MNDHKGAKLMFDDLPSASLLIGDKGYDSDEFRNALASKDNRMWVGSSIDLRLDHLKRLAEERRAKAAQEAA
tara:strand:- start:130 stop:345 length:216 start_codon:yes stop_codon:yes gene_type:complete